MRAERKKARRLKTVVSYAGGVTAALGFLLILGTAGASDAGTIDMGEIVRQLAVGAALFGGGILITRICY